LIYFALLAGLAFLPSRIPAAGLPLNADSPDSAFSKAKALEKEHRWYEASCGYRDLYRKDRNQIEYREGYRRCLRRYYQTSRHNDNAYRQALAKLLPDEALRIYEQVLLTLNEHYVERQRVDIASLFKNGLQELRFALDEPTFVKEYLPGAEIRPEALQEFRDWLNSWHPRRVTNRYEAHDQVREIARAAQVAGLISKPSAVAPAFALEFACGACNALDEYTLFVTPDQEAVVRPKVGQSVRYEMLTRNFSRVDGGSILAGMVSISHFTNRTRQDVREALLDLRNKGSQGLILDLRGNPGGLFMSAVEVAELFIGEGVIVSTQGQIKDYYNRNYRARGSSIWDQSLPIVVLVDGDTASAAEVLAGALKDRNRAIVVGQQTYGKGSIQVMPLPVSPLDKLPGIIRLTVAHLLSPMKQPYTGRGVLPDVQVQPEDNTQKVDKTLQEGEAALFGLFNSMSVTP